MFCAQSARCRRCAADASTAGCINGAARVRATPLHSPLPFQSLASQWQRYCGVVRLLRGLPTCSMSVRVESAILLAHCLEGSTLKCPRAQPVWSPAPIQRYGGPESCARRCPHRRCLVRVGSGGVVVHRCGHVCCRRPAVYPPACCACSGWIWGTVAR